MKPINPELIELSADVLKTCKRYEKIIGDSVGYFIFVDTKRKSTWGVALGSQGGNKSQIDQNLLDWVEIASKKYDSTPIENIDRDWRGVWPSIVCTKIGDCAKGFKFLLENYPPWQVFNHRPKLHKRAAKRIGKPTSQTPPVEAL